MGSATSSTAQNTPSPRTSPTDGCRVGDVAERGSDDVVAEVAGVGEHTLVLEDADARHGRRARQRVPRVGEPAGEHPSVVGVGDVGGDHDAAERDVAGVDALREGDEVGLGVPVLPGEPLTGTTETGHHLIGDPHDAELVAHGAQALEVARRRDEDAVGADDRFEEDRRDLVGALDEDRVAQMLQCPLSFLFGRVGVERRAVRVGPQNFTRPGTDGSFSRRRGSPVRPTVSAVPPW